MTNARCDGAECSYPDTHSKDCTSKKGSKENPILIEKEYPSIAMWFERMSESCGCEHEVIRVHCLWPYVVDISEHNRIVDTNISLGTQLMDKFDEVERLQKELAEARKDTQSWREQAGKSMAEGKRLEMELVKAAVEKCRYFSTVTEEYIEYLYTELGLDEAEGKK